MKTDLPVASSEDPSWMRDPPLEINLQHASASATGMGTGAAGIESDALAAAQRRRRRRRLSYDTDDEEGLEDCCCCPSDPCLAALLLFHCIAGLLGVCAMVTNAYHLTKPMQQQQQAVPNVYIDHVLRSYCIVMSAVIVCAESDWKFLMRRLKLFDLWIFRGIFYAYVGLCTLDLYSTSFETPECIVGLALVVVGFLYVIFGALCLKSVAARRRNNYREITEENVVYESV